MDGGGVGNSWTCNIKNKSSKEVNRSNRSLVGTIGKVFIRPIDAVTI